jgi:hypothetical protein
MLRGRIISINFTGEWKLTISGYKKTFTEYKDLQSYLIKCRDNAKDKFKKKMLEEDIKHIIK